MAYEYGQTPVHEYPTPLDGTPLDAVSCSKLFDTLGIGQPRVCASKSEQDTYVADVKAAGLGPSSRQIVRVCRTDLDGLIMRNDGTGWVRESSGRLSLYMASEASAIDTGGTTRSLAGLAVDLPCAAQLTVWANIIATPPPSGVWAFMVWLRDSTGRDLTPKRRYGNLGSTAVDVIIQAPVDMPAGAGQVQLWSTVEAPSGSIRWNNPTMSAQYS